MKIKINGKWSKHRPVRANTVGYRAEAIRLNDSDLKELSRMSDRDLCANVRRLAGRVKPERWVIPMPELGKYHSGGTVSGRFTRREIPFHEIPKTVVNVDFAEMEKRVMAQLAHKTGVAEAMLGPKSTSLDIAAFSRVADALATQIVLNLQDRIDEEGCGAAMAALKEWK